MAEKNYLDKDLENFGYFIRSTKTKKGFLFFKYEIYNDKKIRDICKFFDENNERFWYVSTSVNPNKLDLPKSYLGSRIEYSLEGESSSLKSKTI